MDNTLVRLDILASEDAAEDVVGVLAMLAEDGWEEEDLPTGETRFRVHSEDSAFAERLEGALRSLPGDVQIERSAIARQDWTSTWRQFFTPVVCGDFVVLPPWLSHCEEARGRKSIVIEPKSAFGTGHHATTALCLGAISSLLEQGRLRAGQSFLDLGTGSGVLGIGCCLSGLRGVGTDIDALAVENARENAALNHVSGLEILPGSTEAVRGRTFDLVVANILAQPLMALAADIVALRGEHGALVLSGLLEIQADGVEAAYAAQGMPPARRLVNGEWCALVWA